MYAIIMAGGKGERFWPASRTATPKQCLKIFSDKSMIEEAVDRLAPIIPRKNVYISTGNHLYEPIKKVLPDVHYVLEPMAKNTAACIGLSAIHIMATDPHGVMFIETADHVYKDTPAYLKHIQAAEQAALEGNIVLLGIAPTFPSTGYGYIKQGEPCTNEGIKTYKVGEFREKPDFATAQRFIQSGDYLWNSGMFIFTCSTILEAMKEHMPKLYAGLMRIREADLDPKVTQEVFADLESISIDYGIMEKVTNTVVVRGEMDWDDVGDWLAMERVGSKDTAGNVIRGEAIALDTTNSVIFSDRLVATLGVDNLIIVSTPDALLVCRKDRAQDIKQITSLLEKKYR